MRKLFFISIASLFTMASGQTVTTYAGIQYKDSGKFNSNASNPLTSEYYSRPDGICVDTNGRFYVTDEHNVMMCDGATSRNRGGYRGDPNSVLSLGSDDGVGLTSRFAYPAGCAVHPSSNDVYVCDKYNGTIRKGIRFVNSSIETSWSTYAGVLSFLGDYVDGPISSAKFSQPEDIEIINGEFYIADFGNNCIRKISNGNVSTLAGNGRKDPGYKDASDTNALFDHPFGLCKETSNTILVADRNNGAIRRVNLTTGAVTTVISNLNMPTDVLYINGYTFILEGPCIKLFDGSTLRLFAGNPKEYGFKDADGTSARFRQLTHLTYRGKSDKSLYVVDNGNNVVRKIPLSASITSDFSASSVSPIVNQTVKLTSVSSNALKFEWSISPSNYTLQAGSKLTDKDIYVSFPSTGTYSVNFKTYNFFDTITKTKGNYINVSTNSAATPVVDFVSSSLNPSMSDTITLIDLTTNNAASYKWTITPSTFSFVENTSATSRNPRVLFSSTGQYSVKLDATNPNGTGTLTKNNYINVGAAGVNNTQMISFKMYPNPANQLIKIQSDREYSKIQIISIDGKSWEFELNESNSIDISNFASGVYFVKLKLNGDLNSMPQKLLIQH